MAKKKGNSNKRPTFVKTSITLSPDWLDYLDDQYEKTGASRSWQIRRALKESKERREARRHANSG